MSPPQNIVLLGALLPQGNVSERWPLNLERNNSRVSRALEEHSKYQEMRKVYFYFLIAPHHIAQKLGHSADAWLGSSWTA